MRKKEDPLLMRSPLDFKDRRVEVVMPTFPALLAQTTLHELGDEGPTLRAVLLHQSTHQQVLLLRPRFLTQELRFVVIRLRQRLLPLVLFADLLLA
jgi:hypothetical protein